MAPPVNRLRNATALLRRLACCAPLLVPGLAMAGEHTALDAARHTDPIAPVILGVTGILFMAVLGRFAARRVGQPSVLGELLMGVLLGNVGYYFGSDLIQLLRQGPEVFDIVTLTLAGHTLEEAALECVNVSAADTVAQVLNGPNGAELLRVAHTVDVFSRYGVIFLLFMVGLDTDLRELRQVGMGAARVAVTGVVAPFLLGILTVWMLMPSLSLHSTLFIAATLAATSIGISARVLRDIQRDASREAHLILGAAVMDDVIGLIMLTIVSGVIVAGDVQVSGILGTVLLALAFLLGAIYFSPYFLRFVIRQLCHLDIVEAKMFTSYLFVMVLAWIANLVELATIVGAFTAGVLLREAYFVNCRVEPGRVYTVKDLIMPLEVILVPIFFVLMGIQVKLESFLDWQVVMTAGGLLVAAILGKLVAGLFAGRGVNRLAVGIGMLPRGEVGLIFASIGKSLGVINDFLFSSVVMMVIVTTLIAPPLLKYVMRDIDGAPASS